MKILCLVKFTPNVEDMIYDYENQTLVRKDIKQIVNPDDACALGFALALKKKYPQVEIEVVSMAPKSAIPLMEDILRRRIERGTLLSDSAFGGSDTLATSKILGSYLKTADFDVILTGDHTLDGDTAHIPSQLGAYLDLDQISSIIKIDEESFLEGHPLVEVDHDDYLETYQVDFPAILSICRASRIRYPFVRFADLNMDVSDHLKIIDHTMLDLDPSMMGIKGSATRVAKTWTATFEEKADQLHVRNDQEGIQAVYDFLKGHGYIK